MSVGEEKMQLDRERLSFEREKHSQTMTLEERKFRLESSARLWAQLATFIPILALIIAYYFNLRAEEAKKDLERQGALHTAKILFIDQQLSELYYPVKIRLERDNAVWEISARNKESKTNLKLANDIEARMLLPNHEEILDILKKNFHLLINAEESVDIEPFLTAINRYQRHVTIYKALRATNDKRWPRDICGEGCSYPKDFDAQINRRIKELRNQREQLVRAGPIK